MPKIITCGHSNKIPKYSAVRFHPVPLITNLMKDNQKGHPVSKLNVYTFERNAIFLFIQHSIQ